MVERGPRVLKAAREVAKAKGFVAKAEEARRKVARAAGPKAWRSEAVVRRVQRAEAQVVRLEQLQKKVERKHATARESAGRNAVVAHRMRVWKDGQLPLTQLSKAEFDKHVAVRTLPVESERAAIAALVGEPDCTPKVWGKAAARGKVPLGGTAQQPKAASTCRRRLRQAAGQETPARKRSRRGEGAALASVASLRENIQAKKRALQRGQVQEQERRARVERQLQSDTDVLRRWEEELQAHAGPAPLHQTPLNETALSTMSAAVVVEPAAVGTGVAVITAMVLDALAAAAGALCAPGR